MDPMMLGGFSVEYLRQCQLFGTTRATTAAKLPCNYSRTLLYNLKTNAGGHGHAVVTVAGGKAFSCHRVRLY